MMNYDTIVIGAGITGLMAALGRAERGERVLLLAKGHGTTHWASGCVDLLDADDDPLAAITRLAAERPEHPYAIAGIDALEQGLARLRAACEAAGYPLVGSATRTLLLPTAVGALRPTALVPATMAAGESRQLADGRPTLIAGLHELRDFFPPVIAANLRAQGLAADSAYLAMPPTERHREFGPMIFARLFEQAEFRAQIGGQLAEHVRRGGYARIGLPGILGLKGAATAVRDLQARAGALIFEIPTLPTSVPGARIFHALEGALLAAGGRVQIGSLVQRAEGTLEHEGHEMGEEHAGREMGEEHADGRLVSVYSEAAAREQRHRARRWVLATGGVLGGGLRAEHDGELRETALGLPVRAPNSRGDWFDPRFLAEGGHPIFQAGVAVDAQLRPLDAAGRVVYGNLAVAGGSLAGYDPIREGCLEGVAIATGWRAGAL